MLFKWYPLINLNNCICPAMLATICQSYISSVFHNIFCPRLEGTTVSKHKLPQDPCQTATISRLIAEWNEMNWFNSWRNKNTKHSIVPASQTWELAAFSFFLFAYIVVNWILDCWSDAIGGFEDVILGCGKLWHFPVFWSPE